MITTASRAPYAEQPAWHAERPRFRPLRVLVAWFVSATALLFAAAIVPGVSIDGFGTAVAVAAVVALLNAVLPPLVAAVRLPFTILTGFLLVLALDAAMLLLASDLLGSGIGVDSFGWALLTALVASAVSVVLEVVFGANDDDVYTLRVVQRIARRSGEQVRTDVPGILFLEIDGLAA